MWDEASLIVERENRRMATEAVLFQTAAASILKEEAGKQFNELVKGLVEE